MSCVKNRSRMVSDGLSEAVWLVLDKYGSDLSVACIGVEPILCG